MLEINPQYDGHGTFGRYFGHKGRALTMGIVLLIIEAALSFLFTSTTKGDGLLKVSPSTMPSP